MRLRGHAPVAGRPRRGRQRGGPGRLDLADAHDEYGDDHEHRRRGHGEQPEHPALETTPPTAPAYDASLAGLEDQRVPAWRRRPHDVRLNGAYPAKEGLAGT